MTTEWIAILLAAGLALLLCAAFSGALFVIVMALLLERFATARRLEQALQRISLVQADLFVALSEAYKRVEHSHSMVIRLLKVVDRVLDVPEEQAGEAEDEFPDVIGGEKDTEN